MTALFESVSFVINSVDDARFSRVAANLREFLAPAVPNIVRVPDAKSMAEGLNRGARQAAGDWLVFCHDDIQILNRDARAVLAEAMAMSDMFGACGTTRLTSGNWYDAGQPHVRGHVVVRDITRPGKFELQVFGLSGRVIDLGAKALDGIWIACRRRLFEALRGFDEDTYRGFVGYDIDFSFRAALAGARVGVCGGLSLFHDAHVGEYPEEKLQAWSRAQDRFMDDFGRYLDADAGVRRHDTILLETADETELILGHAVA